MTWNGQFHPICNFSNLFPPKWLRTSQNGQFCPICNFSIFSHRSGSEWPISPNLQLAQSFPTEVAQNDLEWPISPDSQLFQCFPTEVVHNEVVHMFTWTKNKYQLLILELCFCCSNVYYLNNIRISEDFV